MSGSKFSCAHSMDKPPQRVRVVAGSAGGLWLNVPQHFISRPTQDKVKQALFSTLGQAVIEAKVIDLYAGSGSLGIEALSRGATSCIFVEQNFSYAATIRQNLTHCRLDGEVVAQSVEFFFQHTSLLDADLIFLDPPYTKIPTDLATHPLAAILAQKVMAGTFIVWEHASHDSWSQHLLLEKIKQSRYGQSSLLFLRKRA